MKKLLLVFAVGAAAALVGVAHASARMACTPGGTPATRTFCGPAKATLKDHGKAYFFKQGKCAVFGSTWSLNLGTIAITGKVKHKYLGITVFSKKPGTHSAAVSWQWPNGTNTSLERAKVTLKRGLKRGTFTGWNAKGGGKATGSFSCK